MNNTLKNIQDEQHKAKRRRERATESGYNEITINDYIDYSDRTPEDAENDLRDLESMAEFFQETSFVFLSIEKAKKVKTGVMQGIIDEVTEGIDEALQKAHDIILTATEDLQGVVKEVPAWRAENFKQDEDGEWRGRPTDDIS